MKTRDRGLRLRVRVVLGPDVALGPGKADLLEGIEQTGSIAAAGRRMQMSYKRAWYLIDTMNRCFVEPVVSARKGGKGSGGAELTPTGKQVLRLYRRSEVRAANATRRDLAALARLVRRKPRLSEREG